jgi:predicted phage terminase large subunit-like protein
VYVVDWWRDQATTDIWIERQCDLILRHAPLIWFGEAGPIRKSIEPFLLRRMNDRRAFCRLEWLPSIGKKDARARSFQALASMGKVFLPAAPVPWKADLLGQLSRFPAGRFDDGVDVCSLLGRGLEHVRTPKIARPAEGRHVETSGGPNHWMAG